MKVVIIDKGQWAEDLEGLKKSYQLFGPVGEKDYTVFKTLEKGMLPDFSTLNTRLSPKSIVFPQSEDILEFSLDETREDHHIMKEVKKDHPSRAVFGIRPCDAKSISLVKLNFDTAEYKDPYWLSAYEATTFVGLACDNPASTCFCTTAGCGPYHEEGLDVLLTDEGDHFVAKALTDKGETLIKTAGWATETEDTFKLKKKTAESKITSAVETGNLENLEILDLHGATFWDDISFACLNCGTCTYVCPTCWCFDIQDEVHGKSGKRMRNWDSCMFPLFTIHTTGHNPRGTKMQRVRQRFMHKLKYFLDKYNQGIMCVGCGRCVRQCPVNIDIRRVCNLMNSYKPEDACAAQE